MRVMPLMSNPCNPTGKTKAGSELEDFVRMAEREGYGGLIDEAYELFHSPPVSSLQYIQDIDNTNVFVTGACTKGFQAPGIRIGWCIASETNIKTLSNYSSFGMGGVSHPSQMYAVKLMEESRAQLARQAVPEHYEMQRVRYGKAFQEMGLKLWSGDGGFYHWCELPAPLTCEELNKRLFKKGAAILRGTDCDMMRPLGAEKLDMEAYRKTSPLTNFFRFSFGPLLPETFEGDIKLLGAVLAEYKAETDMTMMKANGHSNGHSNGHTCKRSASNHPAKSSKKTKTY